MSSPELSFSRLSLLSALESSPSPISIVTTEGEWLWSSDHYLKLLSPEETKISAESREELLRLIAATASREENIQPVVVAINGEENNQRVFSVIAKNVLSEDDVDRVCLYGTEITGQRSAESREKLAYSYLSTAVNSLDDVGILLTDADSKIVAISQLLLDISGISVKPQDLVGNPAYTLIAISTNYLINTGEEVRAYAVKEGLSTDWSEDVKTMADGTLIKVKYIAIRQNDELVGHMYMTKVISRPSVETD